MKALNTTLKTSEIAKLANVHPNTVRLYESWGFISPVPRTANGYRQYTIIHALQMKIARIAFRQEFIQNDLRKKATIIVVHSGKEQFHEALIEAKAYLTYLQSELDFTNTAVHNVEQLLQHKTSDTVTYTHKEIAQQLKLTEETLRNWERNGLYSIKRTTQNRRVYTASDLNKLLIIRTLRSAHFSISSIRHFLVDVHQINSIDDIRKSLNETFKIEFFHVTDALEDNLKRAIADIESVIALLKNYISGDLSLASISRVN